MASGKPIALGRLHRLKSGCAIVSLRFSLLDEVPERSLNVGEFVAAQTGLGYVIISPQSSFDTTRTFAAVIVLALVGTGLFYLVDILEALAVPWHVSRQRGGGAPAARP